MAAQLSPKEVLLGGIRDAEESELQAWGQGGIAELHFQWPPFSTSLLLKSQDLLYINVKYLNHYFEGSRESSLSGAPT